MSQSRRATRRGTLVAASVMASLALSSPAHASSDSDLALAGLLLFGVGVIGGTVASIGTQVQLIRGYPDREWANASYGLAGLNGLFAVGWFIAGAVVKDEPALYGVGTLQLSIAIADLIPALITTSALPSEAAEVPGREGSPPTAFPLLHLRGTF